MEATKERIWEALTEPPGLDMLDDVGDLIPLAEFLEDCRTHSFIDYDGNGNWATATKCDRTYVFPSYVLSGKQVPPNWCTHVIWYNR